jgi:hypothetical protein
VFVSGTKEGISGPRDEGCCGQPVIPTRRGRFGVRRGQARRASSLGGLAGLAAS